jgi:hypothetical protein
MVLDLNIVRARSCRVCGCTDDNCVGCVARTGHPCFWVRADLCSACASLELLLEQALERARAGLWVPQQLLEQALELLRAGDTSGDLVVRFRHAVNEHGDCAPWCKVCTENVRTGLNPDGTPIETTGAGAAAGPAHTQHEVADAHVNGPGLGGLQTDPSHAAAGGAGNSGTGPQEACSQEPTGPLRGHAKISIRGLWPTYSTPLAVLHRVRYGATRAALILHDYPALRRRLWEKIRDYAVITGGDPANRGSLIATGQVENAVSALMEAARVRGGDGVRIARAPDLFVRLWEAVNAYACSDIGAHPRQQREDAVIAVEAAVAAIAHDAVLTARAFARTDGWRQLAQAVGEPGLELDPERLVAVLVERLNVLEACKMPDDPELGGLVRAAAGLPGPLITALRDVAEAGAGELEAGGLRQAFRRLGAALRAMYWGKAIEGVIDYHADDVVMVCEVLSAVGFTRAVEVVAAWTSEQRRAALQWAIRGRIEQPPEAAPAFLEEGDA